MFILIGITGGSFYFFLQNTAAAHTSAANVSILVSMSPIITVILAQFFSRRGRSWVNGCIWAQWWPSPALSWWC
ncbi:MAG: EamA family transporter [Oscillospiraceae bacterium]